MGLERTEADVAVQRAIEGRYLPAARADRLAAQTATREALKPAPSHVGWESRPTKADMERERAAERDRVRRAGRRTAEDKALRRQLRDRDRRWDHKRHGTPATLEHAEQHRTGALARLHQAGTIDADQLAAALDIAEAHEQIARDVTPRTASFETRIDAGRRGDGRFYEALGRVQREVAYTAWYQATRLCAPIGAVLAMIVGEWPEGADDEIRRVGQPLGYSVVARRWGMSPVRARRLLIEALDRWWSMLAQARHEIRQGDLEYAHARIERFSRP